jgi:phage tail sheath protein FI
LYNRWAFDANDGGRWWLFPLAVKGFFDNGGQRLYVKRVFSGTAVASSGALGKGLASEIVADALATATDIRLRHLINVFVGKTINIFRGDTPAVVGNFTVRAFDTASGRVTLDRAVGQALVANRGDYVEIETVTMAPVAAAGTTLTFSAKSKGAWSESKLSVRVRPMVGATLTILADPNISVSSFETTVTSATTTPSPLKTTVKAADVTGLANGDQILVASMVYRIANLDQTTRSFEVTPTLPQGQEWAPSTAISRVRSDATTVVRTTTTTGATPTTTVTVDDIRDFANGDHILVASKEYVVGSADTTAKTFQITPALPPGVNWNAGTFVKRLRQANRPNTAATLNVRGGAGIYKGALIELSNGNDKEIFTFSSAAGDTVTLSRNLTKTYYEGHQCRIIEAEVGVRYSPQAGLVEAEETFGNLRLKDDGSVNYLVTNVNTRSVVVEVAKGQAFADNALASFPVAPGGGWLTLTGGNDKLDDLSLDDFVGVDGGSGKRTGIQALEDISEVSICLVPCVWSRVVQSALIQHCELLKDRFSILDAQDGLSIKDGKIQAVRAAQDSKYGALYFPWIEARDPSAKRNVLLSPSGHVAGIYARVDVERGVHKAPANEVIRGITRIEQEVTKREQDFLNPLGINALRFFAGRDNRVWGARTISSDASWKYINVRRLFIYVEKSIDRGTQWVVFEPNDEPLWSRVRQTITNFLTTTWRSGALQGLTPAEAFFVKCDRTTMMQDDIDNGRLICVIGIAPVKPAEFVIFRIQQKTLESKPS